MARAGAPRQASNLLKVEIQYSHYAGCVQTRGRANYSTPSDVATAAGKWHDSGGERCGVVAAWRHSAKRFLGSENGLKEKNSACMLLPLLCGCISRHQRERRR